MENNMYVCVCVCVYTHTTKNYEHELDMFFFFRIYDALIFECVSKFSGTTIFKHKLPWDNKSQNHKLAHLPENRKNRCIW